MILIVDCLWSGMMNESFYLFDKVTSDCVITNDFIQFIVFMQANGIIDV